MGTCCVVSGQRYIVSVDDSSPDTTVAAGIAYLVLACLVALIAFISFVVQTCKPANYGKFSSTHPMNRTNGESSTPRTSDTTTAPRDATAVPEGTERGTSDRADSNAAAGLTAADRNCQPRRTAETPSKDRTGREGCRVPQRVAHVLSDGPSGVILVAILFAALPHGETRGPVASTLFALWVLHYLHRGFVHPFVMKYSEATVDVGIMVGGMFPNLCVCSAVALHLRYVPYPDCYACDPRFIIGLVLFVTGFVINRWADWHLRCLRVQRDREIEEAVLHANTHGIGDPSSSRPNVGLDRYVIPTTFLYRFICNPNYFGELVQWVGWAVASWSFIGLAWVAFCVSTFLPRSLANLSWYVAKFGHDRLPRGEQWKALIPFVL